MDITTAIIMAIIMGTTIDTTVITMGIIIKYAQQNIITGIIAIIGIIDNKQAKSALNRGKSTGVFKIRPCCYDTTLSVIAAVCQ